MGARNWMRGQIVGWLRETPGEDDPEWEDTGRIGRASAWIRDRRWFVAVATFFLVGLIGASAPYIPEFQAFEPFTPWAIAAGILTAGYVWGHGSALEKLGEIEQYVVYTGDSAAVFFGRATTTETGSTAFEALSSMGFRGFGKKYQTIRDRFARRDIERHKEKYPRFAADGDDTLRYRMPDHTVHVDGSSTDADVLKRVHVAHAGELEDDLDSTHTDVQASIPRTIDVKSSNQISRYVSEQEETNQRIKGRLRVLKRELDAMTTMEQSLTADNRDRLMSELDVIAQILNNRSINAKESQESVDLSGVTGDATERADDRTGDSR